MNPRVLLTTSVTSGLFGLYVVYALVMNTLIGVQTLETAKPVELPPPEPPADYRQMAEQYLTSTESEAWEQQALYRVRSGDAYLYYNEWEHRPYRDNDPDNAVEFNPFAMILQNHPDRPFTMQAETALMRFAKEFDFSNPDTGRPVDGALRGKVRITGPNGLVILGRNFVFQEDVQRIFSEEMVQFRFGNHYGTAGGIQLDLDIDPEKIAKEQFAVAGVNFIKLRRHVDLHLSPKQAGDEELSPEPLGNVEELTVTCQGGLIFDTALNVATLRDDVTVSMPTQSSVPDMKQYDSLECDKLKLLFVSEKPDVKNLAANPKEEAADSGFQKLQGNLTLTQIEATSESARQPVIFKSQKNALEARMSHFHYNRITRRATLTDLNNQVSITQRQARIFSPQIFLEHDEQGEMQSVLCDRAGWMHYYDEKTGELSLTAKWQRHLRVHPEEKNDLYLIELDHQASVQRPQEDLELLADHINLWVSGGTPKNPGSSASVRDTQMMENGQPQNLLALGNVQMKHPLANGHTDRLEVWFQDAPAVVQPVRRDVSDDKKTARKADNVRNSVLKVARQSASEADNSSIFGDNRADENNEPFDIWANLIQVLVYRAEIPDESYVGGVVTTGDVTITQPKTDGSQPLRMEGNRIEVRNRDLTNQNLLVHVFGTPARIADAEMSLAGNLLNLDRASNRAWVTGPGVMMQPVDRTLDGKALEKPELLKVWWKEKMEFDGRTAHFYDRVRTELGTSSVLCQEMKVTLSRRVDFEQNPQSVRNAGDHEKTDIDRLECLYGVQVDSEAYENGELMEIRQGEFGELVYERSRDKSTIVGPGRLYLWRQAKEGSHIDGLPAQNEAIANQPLRTQGKGWEFYQIDFNGDIDGQLDQQITYFDQGVQIVYGLVKHTGQKVDPHNLPDPGGWIRSEKLEVARHEKTDTEEAWIELKASGNVKLEGYDKERFRASADTVTFDESKQMYRFRTESDRNTRIWRQKTPGGRFDSAAVAKVMQFVPSKHDLKSDQTISFEGIE